MKKKRASDWISVGKYLAFAFLLGYLISFIIYQGYWYPTFKGVQAIAWFYWPIGLIVVFFITLTLHELGHLLAFVFQGIKIRALYVFVFVFYRSTKGIRFKFQPKLWYLIGGFVVPDLPIIRDDITYLKVVRKFARSLMTASIVTIMFMILVDLSLIVVVYHQLHSNILGWLFMLALFTTLISLIYIKTFSLSNQSFYGDFVAFHKIKEDHVFQIIQIIQYQQFRLTDDAESSFYLHQKLTNIIEKTHLNTSLFHQIMLMQYIEHIIFDHLPNDKNVEVKIQHYPKNHLYRSLEGLILLYDLAAYHYFLGDVDKAYQIIEMNAKKANQTIDEKQRYYLALKFKHMLHYEYHEDELTHTTNISLGKEDLFDAILDLETLRKAAHEPLPFREWSCLIPTRDDAIEK